MILAKLSPCLRWCLVMASCISLIACTNLTPIELGQASEQLTVGNKVAVMTLSGKKLTFMLGSIGAQGISGEGHSLAYGDIETLHRVNIDGTRTTLLIVGIIAVVAAAGGGGGGGGGGY